MAPKTYYNTPNNAYPSSPTATPTQGGAGPTQYGGGKAQPGTMGNPQPSNPANPYATNIYNRGGPTSGTNSPYDMGFALANILGGPDIYQALAKYQMLNLPDRTGEGIGLQKNALNIGANADLARNALDLRALGLDRESLGFDLSDIGIQGRGLDVDQRQAQALRDLLHQQQGFTNQGYDLASQLLGIQREGIGADFDQGKRAAVSDATVRGAIGAPGLQTDYNTLAGTRDRAIAGNETQLKQAGLSRDESLAGLENQLTNNWMDFDRIGLGREGLENDKGRVGLKGKALDLEAEKLGITADELRQKLNNGLAQLGLQGQINADQLLAKKAGAVGGVFDSVNEVMRLALQLGGQYGNYVGGQ